MHIIDARDRLHILNERIAYIYEYIGKRYVVLVSNVFIKVTGPVGPADRFTLTHKPPFTILHTFISIFSTELLFFLLLSRCGTQRLFTCTHTEPCLLHIRTSCYGHIAWNFCADHLIHHIRRGCAFFLHIILFLSPASHAAGNKEHCAKTNGQK